MDKEEAKRIILDIDRAWRNFSQKEYVALGMAIESLEQESKTGWIPVSERLPKEAGIYMTTIDYGKHRVATEERYYYGQNLGWDDDDDNCVVAWMMPFPEPYKVESEAQE